MGITYSVFSGAMHTRFEHCIGTGYLSYTLLETLEENSGIQIGGMLKKCVVVSFSWDYVGKILWNFF